MGYLDNLCIRWNEYESNFKQGLSELLQNGELFDVTLISGSRVIKAHKVILSACSPVFRSIIQSIPSYPHPVIYLKDINFDYLELILSFLYYGEMRVASEVVNDLIKVAEEFQIKGLSNSTNSNEEINILQSNKVGKNEGLEKKETIVQDPSPSGTKSHQNPHLNNSECSTLKHPEENKSSSLILNPTTSQELYSPMKKNLQHQNQHQASNYNPNEQWQDLPVPNSTLKMKRENTNELFMDSLESSHSQGMVEGVQSHCDDDISHDMSNSSSNFVQREYSNDVDGEEFEEGDFLSKDEDEKYHQILIAEINKHFKKNKEKGFECKKCKYTSRIQTNIKRHIEAKHIITRGFPCPICKKNFKTRSTLRSHHASTHARESVVIL
ncbi:uncharacterized protein [Lepeophtheirus salmonis]|uniref:uncharacterized protein n=1 Tax=Lepeophtheirus salmonis TaxID=72036 RepID=UPI001AE5D923|nr:protein abrupt-like [Lepeophtheirus salmonis]